MYISVYQNRFKISYINAINPYANYISRIFILYIFLLSVIHS